MRGQFSRRGQLAVVAALALGTGLVYVAAGLVGTLLASEPAGGVTQEYRAPGTFKPTDEQWKALEVAPVELVTFHSENVTEGSISNDEDLTTPVYSPYSGHVV